MSGNTESIELALRIEILIFSAGDFSANTLARIHNALMSGNYDGLVMGNLLTENSELTAEEKKKAEEEELQALLFILNQTRERLEAEIEALELRLEEIAREEEIIRKKIDELENEFTEIAKKASVTVDEATEEALKNAKTPEETAEILAKQSTVKQKEAELKFRQKEEEEEKILEEEAKRNLANFIKENGEDHCPNLEKLIEEAAKKESDRRNKNIEVNKAREQLTQAYQKIIDDPLFQRSDKGNLLIDRLKSLNEKQKEIIAELRPLNQKSHALSKEKQKVLETIRQTVSDLEKLDELQTNTEEAKSLREKIKIFQESILEIEILKNRIEPLPKCLQGYINQQKIGMLAEVQAQREIRASAQQALQDAPEILVTQNAVTATLEKLGDKSRSDFITEKFGGTISFHWKNVWNHFSKNPQEHVTTPDGNVVFQKEGSYYYFPKNDPKATPITITDKKQIADITAQAWLNGGKPFGNETRYGDTFEKGIGLFKSLSGGDRIDISKATAAQTKAIYASLIAEQQEIIKNSDAKIAELDAKIAAIKKTTDAKLKEDYELGLISDPTVLKYIKDNILNTGAASHTLPSVSPLLDKRNRPQYVTSFAEETTGKPDINAPDVSGKFAAAATPAKQLLTQYAVSPTTDPLKPKTGSVT